MQAYKPQYECDLHCHTMRSDGNDTPEELVKKAAALKMRAVAIVDHDIMPERPPDIKRFAESLGLVLVMGCEFSCDSYVDDVHIIGYELDWKNPLVLEEEEKAKLSKSEAYRDLCDLLSEKGMPIDYENEILQHIDIWGNLQNRKPQDVQRKHIFELMAAKGYFASWEKAKLAVRDNPGFNIRRRKINPLKAIEIIKQAGGLSVLAHPYLIDENLYSKDIASDNRENYIENLIDAGLDGIESCYTYSKTTYRGSLPDSRIKEIVENKYRHMVKFFTGGSDYHGDAKKGASNPRMIGEAGISFEQYNKIF
ncbi:MAG: PHP domain-containing protein [Candidatus Humimicrobiaceae bacterium]